MRLRFGRLPVLVEGGNAAVGFSFAAVPPANGPARAYRLPLVFIGIKGSVVALNRATGQQVWATHLKGSDFVNVAVQNGAVLASCYGEIFCLDPLTGDALWHNPLKGFGRGLATIATEDNPGRKGPCQPH